MTMTVSTSMPCPGCGAAMNRHAEKLVEGADGQMPAGGGEDTLLEAFSCPQCGENVSRPVAPSEAARS